MSSSINVFVVDLDQLRGAIGARNEKLVAAICEDQESFLATIDDIDDEAELKCGEAVGHLICGTPSDEYPGYLYGYALEAICRQLGRELENICPICGASDWLEEVDQALQDQKVPVALSMLVYGICPVEIPTPDDYPFIGSWPHESIPPALAALQRLETFGLDREMTETFQQIRSWLADAATTPGQAIMGFLS
jgi:hypothetical protein